MEVLTKMSFRSMLRVYFANVSSKYKISIPILFGFLYFLINKYKAKLRCHYRDGSRFAWNFLSCMENTFGSAENVIQETQLRKLIEVRSVKAVISQTHKMARGEMPKPQSYSQEMNFPEIQGHFNQEVQLVPALQRAQLFFTQHLEVQSEQSVL